MYVGIDIDGREFMLVRVSWLNRVNPEPVLLDAATVDPASELRALSQPDADVMVDFFPELLLLLSVIAQPVCGTSSTGISSSSASTYASEDVGCGRTVALTGPLKR